MKKSYLKYSNIYDKDGNLVRKVDEVTGKTPKYTLEEVEELVKKLQGDVDENGKPKDPQGLANAMGVLIQMYRDPKNFNKFMQKYIKIENKPEEKEDVTQSLLQMAEEIKEKDAWVEETPALEQPEPNLDPEYVEFEPIEESTSAE